MGRCPLFLLAAIFVGRDCRLGCHSWLRLKQGLERITALVPESFAIVSSEKWITEKVERLIEPAIEAMGFELVRVRLTGDQRRVLQVMAEPSETSTMTVDNCAAISRTISMLLDVEDPIPGEYVLEVSSPGIDRPLVKSKDFERFAGYEIKLEAARLIDGRRRFRGRLKGIVDGSVRLELESGEAEIAYTDIAHAKLVVTDDLLAKQEIG